MINFKFNIIIFILIVPILLFGNDSFSYSSLNRYSTDESGHVYMYLNVIGHVKNPGSYKIYEGTDLISILSTAGGYLPGSNLNKIIIYRKNIPPILVNFDTYLTNGVGSEIKFEPNDTIFIKESFTSNLLSRIGIINTILTALNLYITLTVR